MVYGVVIVVCVGLGGNYVIEGFGIIWRKGKGKGFGIGCGRERKRVIEEEGNRGRIDIDYYLVCGFDVVYGCDD